MMAPEDAEAFCNTFLQEDGHPAWIIGRVIKGPKVARIVTNVTVIEA